ncbi:hypothetical protein, conserved [Eimeria brunetti]|uniref:Uncharacterized protein n=1 Tax=Eimeria brunetti TaxID=51314 RepID=U6LUT4_9EIME|nr:hypothetical protein, conserved [Eimeria brunetti]
MQPPELRLYSRAELLQQLEKDIMNASDDKEKQMVGSEESWWHLCSVDKTFPFYVIPTPITILECGAGTGLLAAHLLPLLQQQLQQQQELQQCGSSIKLDCEQQQQQQQQGSSSAAPTEDLPPLVTVQVCSGAHNNCSSSDSNSSSSGPAAAAAAADSLFSYVASEPRSELQWLETWGMRCSGGGRLPLGVDYEVPQEHPQDQECRGFCTPSSSEEGEGNEEEEEGEGQSVDVSVVGREALKGEANGEKEGRKRRRESTDEHNGNGNGRQWKSANMFCSIPPEVPATAAATAVAATPEATAETAENDRVESSAGCTASTQHGQQRMQKLLPLHQRPYYNEGFERLPPLPTEDDAGTTLGEETTENTLLQQQRLLQQLQQAQPLSRFDSLYSLRAELPPVSQIVVFRRMRNTLS